MVPLQDSAPGAGTYSLKHKITWKYLDFFLLMKQDLPDKNHQGIREGRLDHETLLQKKSFSFQNMY